MLTNNIDTINNRSFSSFFLVFPRFSSFYIFLFLYDDCIGNSDLEPHRSRVCKSFSESWDLVLRKRAARAHCPRLPLPREGTSLSSSSRLGEASNPLTPAGQDLLVARALADFRSLGRVVVQAVRRDDRNFYCALLKDGADYLAPQDVRQLWAVLRRS